MNQDANENETLRQELRELRETVTALQQRVSTLEGRVDSPTSETRQSDVYDRYDETVLELLESVVDAPPRQVMEAYGTAGVRDRAKQKRRTKRLKRLEGRKMNKQAGGVPAAPRNSGKTVGFVLRVTPSVTNRHTSTTPHTTCGACAVCHDRHSVGPNPMSLVGWSGE